MLELGRVGYGAMPLSTPGRPPRADALALLGEVCDLGVGLVDTADAYCLDARDVGHNERLIAEALDGRSERPIVATKGGHVRGPDGEWWTDGRPEHLLAAARASRARLRVDRIDLYQFHRPDPAVDVMASVRALAELQRRGIVAEVGLSNVDRTQIDMATSVVPVASVQNEFSPYELGSLDVLAWCHRARVPFLAWAPLGGRHRAAGSADALPTFRRIARERDLDVAAVVLSWELSFTPMMTVIPGTRSVAHLHAVLCAAALRLDEHELDALDRSVGVDRSPFR